MTTAYDPFGVPGPRRAPQDPLLSLPDHPSGEWAATTPRTAPRFGHPRPASRFDGPYLPSPNGTVRYPVVADPATEPAVLNGRGRGRLVTMALVLLLLMIAGWQAWRLDRVDHRLGASTDQLAAALQRQDQLTQRADDDDSIAPHRVAVYLQETSPVLEYYRRHGLVHAVNGNRTVDAVQADLLTALERRIPALVAS